MNVVEKKAPTASKAMTFMNGMTVVGLLCWAMVATIYVTRKSPSLSSTTVEPSLEVSSFSLVEETSSLIVGEQSHRRLSADSGSGQRHHFLSDQCLDYLTLLQSHSLSYHLEYTQAYVILPVHDLDRSLVVQSVASILRSSASPSGGNGVNLVQILLLDDFSTVPVSSWIEWDKFSEKERKVIKFLRSSSSRKGSLLAKSNAVKFLSAKLSSAEVTKTMLVFMDEPSIVSPFWLDPMALTLTKYPDTLVYPAVDVLVKSSEGDSGRSTYEVAKSDDMVASFTWSFLPRWELVNADNSKRLKHLGDADSSEVLSPSVPAVFATSFSYFMDLEGFDLILSSSKYHQENIDLSLRAWLCGGQVIRQSCSRVAQYFDNFQQDSTAGKGVRQEQIDMNVMNLAQRYFSLPVNMDQQGVEAKGFDRLQSIHHRGGFTYRELAFQDRFLQRIPYSVATNVDPVRTGPEQSSLFPGREVIPGKGSNQGKFCVNFMWYLQEIYPGLAADIEQVIGLYTTAMNSETTVLSKTLSAMIALSYPENIPSYPSHDETALARREDLLLSHAATALGIQGVVGTDFHLKKSFNEPALVKKPKEPALQDLLDIHGMEVRESLDCRDFVDAKQKKALALAQAHNSQDSSSAIPSYCEATTSYGDTKMCENMKVKLLFTCPKICGYCDSGIDKFCEDFYLMKCKTWKSQGMCGKKDPTFGDISANCRKSCNVCTPDYMKPDYKPLHQRMEEAKQSRGANGGQGNEQQPQGGEGLRLAAEMEDNNSNNAPAKELPVDPHALHRDYLEGKVPDDLAIQEQRDTCSIKDTADGQILSRIQIHPDYSSEALKAKSEGERGARIFCGIYTMEKSHKTNVRATRNTWAKKCDGFIAFSTKTDPEFNAMEIKHEGDESYDNMWQKSRSIWKFIYEHFADQFDFFLLGGDDMFYVIENLRAFLNSDEIQTASVSRNGECVLFLQKRLLFCYVFLQECILVVSFNHQIRLFSIVVEQVIFWMPKLLR